MHGFVVADVSAGDVHEVVGVASHQMTTLDIGDFDDLRFEIVE